MKKYISDCHFFHSNLIGKMDKRPFADSEEMTEYMVSQWNTSVSKNDEVIILGDFSFGNGERTSAILRRLNGKKFLIEGNHDHKYLKDAKFDKTLLELVKPYAELNDNGRKVVLCHYPIPFYNGQYRKDASGNPRSFMLYGHIHNTQDSAVMDALVKNIENYEYKSSYDGSTLHIPVNMINCFCMFSDYRPLTLDEWISINRERTK